jgi:hypothetical protein
MLNYELVRAINLDRQRDIKRAVRQHLLRMAAVGPKPTVQALERVEADAPGRASTMVASRLR